MNQILSVSNDNKKKKGQPAEISKVVRFFAIAIIIFGIFLIGTGSYAIYKDTTEVVEPTKPKIEEETKEDGTVLLRVMHDKAIDTVEYYWNDDEPRIINGNGRKYIEQQIDIPGGVNTLNVRAVDVNGEETFYPKEYETEEVIKLEVVGNKLKISAEIETEILYMTYRWDDEEETTVEVNSQAIEQEIDIPMGEHALTVVLVDENNKSVTKEQKVKGVTKPLVKVSLDENIENYLIVISDETGLEKVEFVINGEEKIITVDDNKKELKYKLKLTSGENKLEIIAYNIDGIKSEHIKVKCAK